MTSLTAAIMISAILAPETIEPAICAPTVDRPIVYRHDRADSAYVALASGYRGLVHLNLGRPAGPTDGEGTLIASAWVVTAAHIAREISVGHQVTIDETRLPIDSVIMHPEWRDGGPHDLALLRLARPVTAVEPIRPYRGRDEVGRTLVLLGYGDFGTGLTGPTANDGRVRAATNRIDGATETWLTFAFDRPESSAATRFEGVSGPGDSGGPGLIEVNGTVYLAGVSSGQSSEATGGRPGVYGVTEFYVRISSYVDWIESMIGAAGR